MIDDGLASGSAPFRPIHPGIPGCHVHTNTVIHHVFTYTVIHGWYA